MSCNCNSCGNNRTYNSRNSVRNSYGALGCVRNCHHSGSCLCGHNCHGCAFSEYMKNSGCSAEKCCQTCCGCGNNCPCSGCMGCTGCSGGESTPYSWEGVSSAAEFTAYAPQSLYADGAVVFEGNCDNGNLFTNDGCGVRINRPGRYLAIYTFASSPCENASTVMSMYLSGRELYASRAYMAPAVPAHNRSCVGQAVFCAQAGDVLTLKTSVALTIPQTGAQCPCATMVILKLN